MNKQNRNRLINTERTGWWLLVGRVLGEWVTEVKGLTSRDWQLQNSHVDVKYGTGNRVNDVAMSMCGARWHWEYQREHFIKYVIV